jgi:hypothetical protein
MSPLAVQDFEVFMDVGQGHGCPAVFFLHAAIVDVADVAAGLPLLFVNLRHTHRLQKSDIFGRNYYITRRSTMLYSG